LDPLLIGLSLVEPPLHGRHRRLGVDQSEFDLLIDQVGDFAFRRAAAGFSGAARRFRCLGLDLCHLLSSGLHIRMVFGVFQQHTVEVAAELLQSLVGWGKSAASDNYLRCFVDAQHRRDRSQRLLHRVPLRHHIREIELEMRNNRACLVEPAEATVSVRSESGARLETMSGYFCAKSDRRFLGGPQLVSIRVDLAVQEALCIVHVGSAASRGLLGEDRQQRLNDVLRRVGILVAIRQGQQIQRYRCDSDIGRQPLVERLFLLSVCNSDVQVRQPHQAAQGWAGSAASAA